MRLPEHGWTKDRVLATLESFRANDMPWRDGRTWADVNATLNALPAALREKLLGECLNDLYRHRDA